MKGTASNWPSFHQRTWYADQVEPFAGNRLAAGRHRAGTVIVGAGLAGLATALSMTERGDDDLVVLDRGEPGEGASGRNGGFVFAGYSLDPNALAARMGDEDARRMYGWTLEAVALVARRCDALGVETARDGVLLADWFGDDDRLERYRRNMSTRFGARLEPVGRDRMGEYVRSERYGAGLLEPDAFHFNPKAYATAIARRLVDTGVRVHGDAPVLSLRRVGGCWCVTVPDAEFLADRVVLATGGYETRLVPRAHRAIQPIATYIVVTEPLGDVLDRVLPGRAAIYDTRFAFDYYRRLSDRRLLWGGRISIADRSPDVLRRLMRRDLARVFPELEEVRLDYAWGGWMSYARHQMPILGELEPGLWTALAFGGHGMAPTTLAGEVLAEAMHGERERLAPFSRYRAAWAGGPLGRLAVQGTYWWKQCADALRAGLR